MPNLVPHIPVIYICWNIFLLNRNIPLLSLRPEEEETLKWRRVCRPSCGKV